MKHTLVTLAVATLAVTCSASTFAQTTEAGGLLRDKAGKTLYTFDKDAAGESRCYDNCATVWPAFMAAEGAKAAARLTLVERKGGGQQWAWDGKPLYYFAGDTKPGDTAGEGSGGVWHVIKPAGAEKRAATVSTPEPYKY